MKRIVFAILGTAVLIVSNPLTAAAVNGVKSVNGV